VLHLGDGLPLNRYMTGRIWIGWRSRLSFNRSGTNGRGLERDHTRKTFFCLVCWFGCVLSLRRGGIGRDLVPALHQAAPMIAPIYDWSGFLHRRPNGAGFGEQLLGTSRSPLPGIKAEVATTQAVAPRWPDGDRWQASTWGLGLGRSGNGLIFRGSNGRLLPPRDSSRTDQNRRFLMLHRPGRTTA